LAKSAPRFSGVFAQWPENRPLPSEEVGSYDGSSFLAVIALPKHWHGPDKILTGEMSGCILADPGDTARLLDYSV